MTMNITEPFVDEPTARQRLTNIRAALPNLDRAGARATALALFGEELPIVTIMARVRRSIPARPFRKRATRCAGLQLYRRFVPDAALLAYDDAARSNLFAAFCIMWPVYGEVQQPDPWLIGWTQARWASLFNSSSGGHHAVDSDRGIVLAYWDDDALHPKRIAWQDAHASRA